MSIKPITPKEAKESKIIPEIMIKAVNRLIREKYRSTGFRITRTLLDEHLEALGANFKELHKQNAYDFEEYYGTFGWIVNYDSPGYNESYESYYEFNEK